MILFILDWTFLFIMGIAAYLMIIASFLTGMRIVKVKFKVHRKLGIVGFIIASIHGLLMLYSNLF